MKQIKVQEKSLIFDEDLKGQQTPKSASLNKKDKLLDPLKTLGNVQQKKNIQGLQTKITDTLQKQLDTPFKIMELDQMLSPWDLKENMNDFPNNDQCDDNFLQTFSINYENQQQLRDDVSEQRKFIVPLHTKRNNAKFLNSHKQYYENSQQYQNSQDSFAQHNEQKCESKNLNGDRNNFLEAQQVDKNVNHSKNPQNNMNQNSSSRDSNKKLYFECDEQIKQQAKMKKCKTESMNINQNISNRNKMIIPNQKNYDNISQQAKYILSPSDSQKQVQETNLDMNKNQTKTKQVDCLNLIKVFDSSQSKSNTVSPRFIHISEAPSQVVNNKKAQYGKKFNLNAEQYTQIAQIQKYLAQQKDNCISNNQKIQLDQKQIIHPDLLNYFNKNGQAQFKQFISSLSPNLNDEGKNGFSFQSEQFLNDRQCQKSKFLSNNLIQRSITLQQLLNKNSNFQNYIDSLTNNTNSTRASLELSPEKFIKIKQACQVNQKNKNQSKLTQSQSQNQIPLPLSLTSRQNEVIKAQPPSNHYLSTPKSVSHHQNCNNVNKMVQTNRLHTQNDSEELSNDIMMFKRAFPNSQQLYSYQYQSQQKQNSSNRLKTVYAIDDQLSNNFKQNQPQNENNFLHERNHYNKQKLFSLKEDEQIKVNSGYTTPKVNSNKIQNTIQSERHSKSGSMFGLENLINKTNKFDSPSFICQTERGYDQKKSQQANFPNFQVIEDFSSQKDSQQVNKKSKLHLNQNLLKHNQHLQAKKQKQLQEEKNNFLIQVHLHNQCTQILKNILQESSRKKSNISQKNFNIQSINIQLNKQNELNINHIDNFDK